MTTFTGTSAIALTWTPAGWCRGVRVERARDRCCVVQWWEAQKGADRSIAETLADGLRALDPAGTTIVVAGGDDSACGCFDLEMPALRPEELRNALTFEVRRCAPVPDEKLTWAYRVLPGASGSRLRIRLYYVRQTIWEHHLEDVSALAHGLDMIIPPAAALDPVLAGVPVCLGTGDYRFLFVPCEDGRREALPASEAAAPTSAFGCGPTPLAAACVDPGKLSAEPADRQAGFAAALVLAMYGISASFQADRRTGFEIPYDLRPRRHRQSRLVAVALAIYIVVVALYGAARLYADRRQQYAALHEERLRVEAQIVEAGKRLQADEAKLIEQLRLELADLAQPRPSLGAALAEITRRVGHSGWCTSFRWSEGAISVQLRESQEIEDVERTLESSPLLGDVRQESKTVKAGVIERKVEMNARYDLENEQSAPPPAPPAAAGDDLTPEEETGPAGALPPKRRVAPMIPRINDEAAAPVENGAPSAGAAPAPGTVPPPPPPPPSTPGE
jgi:Tfp pilus assembly protein PilN